LTGYPSLKQLIDSARDKLRAEFELATKQVPHPGGRGQARESVLRDFLASYLPQRFCAESGYVMDAAQSVSRQGDVIVYERFGAPVFRLGDGQNLFLAESVLAVIQVKSFLDAAELKLAVDNLESFARLDRSAGGTNKLMAGGTPIAPATTIRRILTAIFAFDSVDLATCAASLSSELQRRDRSLWPNLVCVLDRGIIGYDGDDGLTIQPEKAKHIYYSLPDEAPHALFKFFVILVDAVSGRAAIRPNYFKYFGLGETNHSHISLAPA
jgi:hypothetical protein